MTTEPKPAQPVDIEVGARIRLRRRLIGMSQDTLAKNIGVSFQQVQKYEKGTNRIGSSRIHQIAGTLNTSVSSLFGTKEILDAAGNIALETEGYAMSKDGMELNKAYLKVLDEGKRAAIRSLIEALSEQ